MNTTLPPHTDPLPAALQLHQAGQFEQARAQYQKILAAQPNRARAHFLLGLVSFQLGHNQDALTHLEKSTQLNPAEPIFHTGLGMVNRTFKRYRQAIGNYRRALELAPRDAGIHFELGLALMQLEDLPAAAESFTRAIELEPHRPMWRLELDSLCPAILPDVAGIHTWRANYARALAQYSPGSVDLCQWLGGDTQSDVYPPFVLPYHGLDDLPLKKRFADIFTVSRPLSTPFRRAEPPYRVGFVVTRSHERIFLSLMGGLLNRLTDPALLPVIIAPHPSVPRLQAGITNPAAAYLAIPEAVVPAAETIRAAQIDLLYYWEAGSDSLNYFLPFFRPAPIQVTSWGLSVTTGIPQMDYFISSRLLEDEAAQSHYSERLVLFDTLPTCFARPELPAPLQPRAHFGLSEEAHLYFCPQNLLKIHPDFDPLLAQILHRDPRGLVLLLAGDVPRLQEDLLRRFASTIPDVLERVRFVPRQNFPDFLNLIALADVLLDTVHYSGGNTAHEALALGTPIVTMPGPFLRGRLTLGRYNKIGVPDCVVNSPEAYVDLAVKLGTDPLYRQAVKDKILASAGALYDDLGAVREFEAFCRQAISAGFSPADEPAGAVCFNEGIKLFNAGNFQAALEQFDLTLSHQPNRMPVLYNRALTLSYLSRFDEAVSVYRRILSLDPYYVRAAYSLAVTLREQDKIEEAVQAYEAALALEPNKPLWRLECDTVFPAIMPSAEAIDQWRRNLALNLAAHPPASIDLARLVDHITEGNGLSVFKLHYHGRNNLELLSRYAGLFTVSGQSPAAPAPPQPRLKLGFVVTASHEQIFLAVMAGLVVRLSPADFDITIICAPSGEAQLRNGLNAPHLRYLPLHAPLSAAIPAIKQAGFHLIYYWEVGTDGVNYFLPFFRPAPVQVTSWGSAGTTGHPAIDYFISSRHLEPENAATRYTEKLVLLNSLLMCAPGPVLPANPPDRAEFGLPAQAHLYVCAQNPLKFHPDFDEALAQILRRDPVGLIITIAGQNPAWTVRLQARRRLTMPDVAERIITLPRLAYADYLALLAMADVALDTFYFGGGATTYDALAMGAPLVTLPDQPMVSRVGAACYRQMGFTDGVAATPQAYVNLALKFGADPALRSALKAKILAACPILYNDEKVVQEMSQFFQQAVQPSPPADGSPVASPALQLDGQTPPEHTPSVSLCMIVKNEEDTLPDCLASLGDFPTEIIVVDTGSTDRTVEIARSFGARVEYFPWIDDFAAARNESIKHATSDWIFWMDADDRISADNLIRLKQALASQQADVYICNVSGDTAGGEDVQTTAHHFRLFRNGLGLKFVYPLHEDLAFYLAVRPVTVAYTNIEIKHIGYSISPEHFQAKARRNLQIINRALEKEPHNARWHHHRGLSLNILGRHQEALAAFQAAQSGSGLSDLMLYDTFSHIAAIYVKLGRKDAAKATLEQALARFPQRRHLHISAGIFYLDLDEPQTAARLLEKARSLPPETFLTQGQNWRPGILETQLGLAYTLLAQPEQAKAAFLAARALNKAPLPAETLREQAGAAYRNARWDQAMAALAESLALAPAQPADWVQLAIADIFRSGQTGSALRICRYVLSVNPADVAAADLQAIIQHGGGNFWSFLQELISRILGADPGGQSRQLLADVAALCAMPVAELIRRHGLRLIAGQAYEPAAEAFALLVNDAPGDVEGYRSLAVALNALGRSDDAEMVWQIAQNLAGKAES